MMSRTRTYRWSHPIDWLAEAARHWPAAKLYQELLHLARLVDADTLQDEYQHEMSADGYFEEESE